MEIYVFNQCVETLNGDLVENQEIYNKILTLRTRSQQKMRRGEGTTNWCSKREL